MALGKLAPHLPAELLPEALALARSIEDDEDRAMALGKLAPHLPAEQRAAVLSEALTAARSIEDDGRRASALGEVAPHLPERLIQQGVEELLSVVPKCQRSLSLRAFSALFPCLRDFEGPKGLEEVRRAIIDTARWFP